MNERYRLIPDLSWDPVRLAHWFADHGWQHEGMLRPGHEDVTNVEWKSEDGSHRLTLVFERSIGVRFVAIAGPNAAVYDAEYEGRAPFYPRHALVELPFQHDTEEGTIEATFMMAVSAPPHVDEAYLKAFERLLQHPSAAVRAEVIAAAAFADWPEMRLIVEHACAHDPDPTVRRAADDFLSFEGEERGRSTSEHHDP